jgi:hypothetical protein
MGIVIHGLRVFVTPGKVMADSGGNAVIRLNRSFKYDSLNDAYARFILTEITITLFFAGCF